MPWGAKSLLTVSAESDGNPLNYSLIYVQIRTLAPPNIHRGMSLARLPFRTGTSVPSEPSQQCLDLREMGPREKTRKKNFVLRASTYAVGSMSSTDAFEKRIQRDDYATHAFRVVVRNPSELQ